MDWFDMPLWRWREDRDQHTSQPEADWQRSRAYKAEEFMKERDCRGFQTTAEIQQWVDEVVAAPYFRTRWPHVRHITVSPKGDGPALGIYRETGIGSIMVPEWAMVDWAVLHEIAHAVTPPDTGAMHGRYWARSYIELVSKFISPECGYALRSQMIRQGVKHSPKRPPGVISTQCAAARPQAIPGRPSKLQFQLANQPAEGPLAAQILAAQQAVALWRARK